MRLKNNKNLFLKLSDKNILLLLTLLSFIGIILSSYSLYSHYSNTSSFCDINEKFNCDIVNKGEYSTFLGIPVALIGLLGYSLLFLTTFFKYKKIYEEKIKVYLILLITGAFLFSTYLTYLESFVIKTYCIICLFSYLNITIMLLLTLKYKEK